jgi:Zn-dependent membrane protease YugP
MYIDPVYWYFAIPGLIISFLAQMYVKYAFNKYSKFSSGKDMTGLETAEHIRNGEKFPVAISTDASKLGDHFDPRKNIVTISSENINSNSIAHIAVVAHEFGHVQQKFTSTVIYRVRQIFVPITQIGTQLGYILFLIGLGLSALRLAKIGLIFFSTSTIFALITLPVEFDASKRAMQFIEKYNLIDKHLRYHAKTVLNAAALTYVAGLLASLLNLLYYINLLNRRRR